MNNENKNEVIKDKVLNKESIYYLFFRHIPDNKNKVILKNVPNFFKIREFYTKEQLFNNKIYITKEGGCWVMFSKFDYICDLKNEYLDKPVPEEYKYNLPPALKLEKDKELEEEEKRKKIEIDTRDVSSDESFDEFVKTEIKKYFNKFKVVPFEKAKITLKKDIKNNIDISIFPKQLNHIKNLSGVLTNHNICVDTSDTGMGKTYTAVATAKQLNLSPIVICPKPAISVWNKALVHFGATGYVNNIEQFRNGNTPYLKIKKEEVKVFRTNSKGTRIYFNTINKTFVPNIPNNSLIIFDEAHCLKNSSTINYKSAYAVINEEHVKTLLLSATIAENPTHLKLIGLCSGLFKKGQFAEFVKFFSHAIKTEFGEVNIEKYSNEVNLHNLLFQTNRAFGMKKKINQTVKDEPVILSEKNKEVINEQCEIISAKIDKMFNSKNIKTLNKIEQENQKLKFQKEKILNKPDKDLVDSEILKRNNAILEVNNITKYKIKKEKSVFSIVQIMHERQIIEIEKLDYIELETMKNLEKGYSVAVFLNFVDSVNHLSKRFETKKIEHVIVQGSVNHKERDANIEKFQSNDAKVIILTTASGGQSISLHDLDGDFPRIAFISPTYSAVHTKQVFGRFDRSGGKSHSIVIHLFADDTIEKSVVKKSQKKMNCIDEINFGMKSVK